jgi:hypothetical protein
VYFRVFYGIHFGTLILHALQKTILEMRALHLKSSGDVEVFRGAVGHAERKWCKELFTLVYSKNMTSSCFG